MRHIVYTQADTYPVALLLKSTAFKASEILTHYVEPLEAHGVPRESLIACTIDYNEHGKAPVDFAKECLEALLPELRALGAKTLYVADSTYFKVLTKQGKAEPHYGYVLPCKMKGYEEFSVVLGLNQQALIYNPDLQAKLGLSLDTLAASVLGRYQPLGADILHSAEYPKEVSQIRHILDQLHQYPELSCDIEAFSLRFWEAGVGTISFAWDQHNGVGFAVDYKELEVPKDGYYGEFIPNPAVREALRAWFESYKGKLTWHNATYDLKVLIYTLWMAHPLDTPGLLKGLEIMSQRFDDTKIIAYLATNSTAGNVLGLKALAHEFAGNWAKEDIKDIRRIPLPELLQYNVVDCLSTQYVKAKYFPIMIQDQQEDLYHSLMLPSLKLIIQIELTGLPMHADKIQEAKDELSGLQAQYLQVIRGSSLVTTLNQTLRQDAWEKDFEGRKAKAKNPGKILPKQLAAFDDVEFNPNSGPQLQKLLYAQLDLPVIDYTDTKQPATGAETLEKLVNHTQQPEAKELIKALIGISKVDKILTSFIPAFEKGLSKGNGCTYLHGSFNLGGTVSGRLSSSTPNLQQIPSNSTFAKLIKKCFFGPPGWIFCGADFMSLEDRINALLTKDPNKLRVYTDGYDGHSLRAYAYFGDQMPDIVNTVESINSLANKSSPYYHLRQDSKSPTFALTFQGTWMTMVKNLGWEEEKAKRVEANYHALYAVSTQWVKDRIQEAAQKGYSEGAFGLRIRTPLLKQVIFNGVRVPREAEAEARTLGNAISGQSYGLLNNRAAVAFMEKVWKSKYRYDILPVALIHDAIYLLILDNVEVVQWVNTELPKEMAWQELPEIQHNQVKLGAELDLFYKGWHQPITLPNSISQQEIINICKEKIAAYEKPKGND